MTGVDCDHPVPCCVRPVTTPVPRVTRATSQVKPSLHDFADALRQLGPEWYDDLPFLMDPKVKTIRIYSDDWVEVVEYH